MDVRILPHLLSSVMLLYLGHSVCGSNIFIRNFEPVFPPTECAIYAKLTLKSSETRMILLCYPHGRKQSSRHVL